MIRPILLTATEIRQIAALKKTMHLVPVRHNRQVNPPVPNPCPYRQGRIYPIQVTPDEPARLHVQITAHSRTTLADLGYSDARHLGHKTTPDMWHTWLTAHQNGYADRPDDTELERLYNRHADRQVWLISMQIAEAPRLLAVRGDYTDDPRDAIPGEPEPVDDKTLEKITAGKLLTADQRRRQVAMSARPKLVSALADLQPLAERDARVKNHAAIIKRQIAAIDKIIGEAA